MGDVPGKTARTDLDGKSRPPRLLKVLLWTSAAFMLFAILVDVPTGLFMAFMALIAAIGSAQAKSPWEDLPSTQDPSHPNYWIGSDSINNPSRRSEL